MQIFIPIVLNIVYPGSGYLYLKDGFRKTIAKFLVFVWTLFIGAIVYEFIKGLITGDMQVFNNPIEIPELAYFMWGFMIYDTYKLAKKSGGKQPGHNRS